MNSPRTVAGSLSLQRRGLALLLGCSYGLRIWLAARGGQAFWDDEGRYGEAQSAVSFLRQGRWSAAAQELLGHPIHTLFPWFGLIPAAFEEAAGPHPAVVAAYFGIYSILAIYLIWAIARRAGAGETEALWAAYLACCANSLFYYSRHFFPYDISLALMLAAFWLGLGPWSRRNSLQVGMVVGIGFLTYNGYWWLGGCVMILHAFLGEGGSRRLAARIACSGAGLALALLLLLGLGRALGHNLAGEDAQGVSLRLGDFSSGPRVIAEYLWHAEGGLLILWVAAIGYALVRDVRREARCAWYAGAIGLLVGGLVFFSDPILFPVQGRRVRAVVPFLCLGAAVGVARFVKARGPAGRNWGLLLALLAASLAAENFSTPLRQVFPDQFRRLSAAAAQGKGYRAYRLSFAENLWGVPLDGPLPPYPAILSRSHPLQFRPYQYEGYDREQRAALNHHDISMRLIPLPGGFNGTDSRWHGYPGPVHFVLRFPRNVPGISEPLIVTGRTGRGDIFYVHYVDAGRVKFGLDHWGVRATESGPIAVDYARPHDLAVSGGLLEPMDRVGEPGLEAGPDRLLVVLDGRRIFALTEAFYTVAPATFSFGVNFIGGSVARPSFTGEILDFGPAPEMAGSPQPEPR